MEHQGIWRRIDLLDEAALTAAVEEFRPDHVYHLAARTDLGGRDGQSSYAVNSEGTRNLIVAISRAGSVKRVIFTSSRMVCRIGHQPRDDRDYSPPNLYGLSKVRMEEVIRASRISCAWCIARITSAWGPWFGVPYRMFFEAIGRGVYFHPGASNPRKSFGFVGNIVHQLMALAQASLDQVHGKTFYLADYEPLELRSWACMIQREFGAHPIRTAPLWLLKLAAVCGDGLAAMGMEEPPLTVFRLKNLLAEMVYDVSQIRSIAGPAAFTIEEGVRLTIDWLRTRS
jgi:nucleoside-diphosphate-sugar epimerase